MLKIVALPQATQPGLSGARIRREPEVNAASPKQRENRAISMTSRRGNEKAERFNGRRESADPRMGGGCDSGVKVVWRWSGLSVVGLWLWHEWDSSVAARVGGGWWVVGRRRAER